MKTTLLNQLAVGFNNIKGSGAQVDIPTGFTLVGLLNLVYTVAGMVAVIVIVIGGILYATSDGDSSKLQRAKNSIVYSVVGLIFVIMAASITNFILGQFK